MVFDDAFTKSIEQRSRFKASKWSTLKMLIVINNITAHDVNVKLCKVSTLSYFGITNHYLMLMFKRGIILAFFSLLVTLHVLGQSKTEYIPKNDFWYKWHKNKASQLGLTNLNDSNINNYWRIWYTFQTISYVIDIYKGSDSLSKCFVTLYTEEYVDQTKEMPTGRIYINKVSLNTVVIDSINKLIQVLHIAQIPNETDIKGWSQGLDGITYCIESVTPKNYTFKSYWTPTAQENIKEAKIIQYFVDRIDTMTNLKQLLKDFTKHIPFESYYTGGPSVASRIMTKKERKRYKRERDAYRKNHHINK
jgi:hypothetical protein